jgi:hypothetical protein
MNYSQNSDYKWYKSFFGIVSRHLHLFHFHLPLWLPFLPCSSVANAARLFTHLETAGPPLICHVISFGDLEGNRLSVKSKRSNFNHFSRYKVWRQDALNQHRMQEFCTSSATKRVVYRRNSEAVLRNGKLYRPIRRIVKLFGKLLIPGYK